jgi:predicted acylesterase/phospholipase RssA
MTCPSPHRAVATDLEKAERVIMKDGSLGTAIRASMANSWGAAGLK